MDGKYYEHWSEISKDGWLWRYFSPKELACSHCGGLLVVPMALNKLEAVRLIYGRPIRIASAYRCPQHPIEIGRDGSPHQTGTAFDAYPVGTSGNLAEMEDAFFTVGVLGRGKGLLDGSLHIHFDWDESRGRRSWGY